MWSSANEVPRSQSLGVQLAGGGCAPDEVWLCPFSTLGMVLPLSLPVAESDARRIVALRTQHGIPLPEIAAALGVSISSVRRVLNHYDG